MHVAHTGEHYLTVVSKSSRKLGDELQQGGIHTPKGTAPPTGDLRQLVDLAQHALGRPGDHRAECVVLHVALGGQRLELVKEACT